MFKMLALTVVFSFLGVNLLAQTTGGGGSSSPDPWVTVLQWGPAGTVLLLLASGQLRFGREMKASEERFQEERAARVKAETDRDAVLSKTANDFIPLLTEATHILADFKPKSTERAVATALSAIVEKLEEIDKRQS